MQLINQKLKTMRNRTRPFKGVNGEIIQLSLKIVHELIGIKKLDDFDSFEFPSIS